MRTVPAGGRYAAMFAPLRQAGEGAFVPFLVLGDPDPDTSLALARSLVAAGADALELGLPFSDPVADGPVIQAAAARALAAGVRIDNCWRVVAELRAEHADLPIGLLVYANLVLHGTAERFYARASAVGVDSVLVADLPVLESAPITAVAEAHGIAPVFIAPPNATADGLAAIAERSRGYVYVVSRPGVTGSDEQLREDSTSLLRRLAALASAPPLLGFGISRPDHVRTALAMGAAGVISGSAVVARIADAITQAHGHDRLLAAVAEFAQAMKAATRRGSP